jgi:hypothetical protein
MPAGIAITWSQIGKSWLLYRISTAQNPEDAKRLILPAFLPYPRIIEHSRRLRESRTECWHHGRLGGRALVDLDVDPTEDQAISLMGCDVRVRTLTGHSRASALRKVRFIWSGQCPQDFLRDMVSAHHYRSQLVCCTLSWL